MMNSVLSSVMIIIENNANQRNGDRAWSFSLKWTLIEEFQERLWTRGSSGH